MAAEVRLDRLAARSRHIQFFPGSAVDGAPVLALHGAQCAEIAPLLEVGDEEDFDGDFQRQGTIVLRGWVFPLAQADLRLPEWVHVQGQPVRGRLCRPTELCANLAAHGWTEPLESLRRLREAKSEEQLRREWLDHAPLPVRHLASEATHWTTGSLPSGFGGRLGVRLQEHLRLHERTLALLRWAGSAGGRFRDEADLPSYESLPLTLLQAYQTTEIVQYATEYSDEALRVGVLRLWTSFRFRSRLHELRMVPPALIDQILALADAVGPQTRADRARMHFGVNP